MAVRRVKKVEFQLALKELAAALREQFVVLAQLENILRYIQDYRRPNG